MRQEIEDGRRDTLAALLARREGRPIAFLCDGSLGGLARWLRAAGYAAEPSPGRGGAELVEPARRRDLVLVTTDHRLLERRAVREGLPVVVLVPSRLGTLGQLRTVLLELGLPIGEPLCMSCGGELRRVAKTDVADRIPPRTAIWKDEYFLCSGCDKLFWQGTHWQRIRQRLGQATAPPKT